MIQLKTKRGGGVIVQNIEHLDFDLLLLPFFDIFLIKFMRTINVIAFKTKQYD